jgi:hypothetical protein
MHHPRLRIWAAAAFFLTAEVQLVRSGSLLGTVSDQRSGKAVEGVNVFLSKTTVGTVTDAEGRYRIETAPSGSYELVFQHVAYEIQTRQVQIEDKGPMQMDARLQPKVLKGQEVRITSVYPKDRMKRLGEFEKAFLGETPNAKKCRLLNPEALEFFRDETNAMWTAQCGEAVLVENRATGYLVRNYILDFKWSNRCIVVQHRVLSVFRQLVPAGETESRAWMRGRKTAFLGSQKHFLSALARERVDEEGFRVYRSRIQFVEDEPGVFKDVGSHAYVPPDILYEYALSPAADDPARLKKVFFRDWLRVNRDAMKSYLNLESQAMIIDTLGNIWNVLPLTVAGYWAYFGVADKLPLDYWPGNASLP